EAEPDVHEVGSEAEAAADREHLLEVELLALVGDVDDAGGRELLDAALDGGEVGGGVVEAAVALPYDHQRQLFLLELDDEGALAFRSEAFGDQFIDQRSEAVIVVAFSPVEIEAHAEALVDP